MADCRATTTALHGWLYVWHGNDDALPPTESPGSGPRGVVRIGRLHYNTAKVVDRPRAALAALERNASR